MTKEELVMDLENTLGATKEQVRRLNIEEASLLARQGVLIDILCEVRNLAPLKPFQDHYIVTLVSAGENKIQMIKAIREHTFLGLKEAKEIVDTYPRVISSDSTADTAILLQQSIQAVGGTVTIEKQGGN